MRALVSLLLLSLAAADHDPSPSGDGDFPAPGTHVWVGEHRLHLHCLGSGSPTVVFESGLGGSSLDWVMVHSEVAAFTRACTYDRAGYAWSDSGPMPRDSDSLVADLDRLLGNGSVAGPYVLVGHSLGGMLVQRYAHRNPDRVAGLVLVDAAHEEQFQRMEEAVRRTARSPWRQTVAMESVHVPEGLPEEVRLLARNFSIRSRSLIALRSELRYLQRITRGAMGMGRLPDVPLVVISHRVTEGEGTDIEEMLATTWMELQRELATRSSRSKHVIATTGDHYVQIREPDTVIAAVREVVAEHRFAE